jgi:osmotically-inducible protein OsmY
MSDAIFIRMNGTKRGLIGQAGSALLVLFLAVPLMAAPPSTRDLTLQFISAGAVAEGFRAVEVGGIVVLRGRVTEKATAEQASAIAQSLGYTRVANLIQVADVPDDERITRTAERQLGVNRGLDGTQISVVSNNGVVMLIGKVLNELQKDMAVRLVKNIDGVRSVQMALTR